MPANSVRKCHFLLSWSIRQRQASTPAGGTDLEHWAGSSCKVSRAKRLSSIEPKTLLKTPGTWFESLLRNRNPKQYIPGLHQNHVCAGPRLLRLSMDCVETTSRMRASIPRFLGAFLRN